MVNPWYVIAGAPSSGKTTLIHKLELLGYPIVEEAARMLITSKLGNGMALDEIRKDDKSFQREIMGLRLELESRAPRDSPAFFDTAIPDNLAYYRMCGLDTAEMEELSRGRYAKVFLLEPLPFKKDNVRIEDDTKRDELYNAILDIYYGTGYKPILVPKMSVEERISFILQNFNNDI